MTTAPVPQTRRAFMRQGLLAVCSLGLCALAGCELISTTKHGGRQEFKLPPLTVPKESIQLEITFIDRPTNDAMIGDSLWKELDQIAGVPAEQRATLRSNGWRIGHASSRPPKGLAEMLDQASEQGEIIDQSRRVIRRRVAVLSGTDAPIEVTETIPQLSLRVESLSEPRVYEQAKCVVRILCERESAGWVRLHLHPEIHHGATLLRPVATQFDWVRRRTADVDPLYDQQFSLNLNVGESVVLTAGETDSHSVADAYFRSLDASGRMQRLLVIRVTDMKQLQPIAIAR